MPNGDDHPSTEPQADKPQKTKPRTWAITWLDALTVLALTALVAGAGLAMQPAGKTLVTGGAVAKAQVDPGDGNGSILMTAVHTKHRMWLARAVATAAGVDVAREEADGQIGSPNPVQWIEPDAAPGEATDGTSDELAEISKAKIGLEDAWLAATRFARRPAPVIPVVEVTGVETGSAAWNSGIRPGDQIVSFTVGESAATPAGTYTGTNMASEWSKLVKSRGDATAHVRNIDGRDETLQVTGGGNGMSETVRAAPAEPGPPLRIGRVSGGSLGLAAALAYVDHLCGGDLTGGRTVAATGTISAAGKVGPIGEADVKTVAAETAGAELMLVPKGQGRTLDAAIRVIEVATLEEAVGVLESFGGEAACDQTA